ncbi:MAG: site-2 protease family protein [Anaerovoracaceae bacterium]
MKRFFNPAILIVLVAMVVNDVLGGKFSDPMAWLMDTLMMLPAIVIALSFHEFAHGFVSYKLGDPTPKIQGRLTLNPIAHMDPFGFIALLFAGFGWGIPVEIDPRYYKHRRRDEALVAVAGVTMNLLLAIVFAFVIKFLFMSNGAWLYGQMGQAVIDILINIVFINIVLMVFNLLPVPPLDGFGIVTQIFKLDTKDWYWKIYDKGFLILLVLIILGVTDKVISPLIQMIYGLIVNGIIL